MKAMQESLLTVCMGLASLCLPVSALAMSKVPDYPCYMISPRGSVLNLSSLCGDKPATPSSATTLSENTAATTPSGIFTMSQYKQIRLRSTYTRVVQILGAPGTEVSSSGSPGSKLSSYIWENSDGSDIQITFENNRVTAKAQTGLQ
jgi:hypothetical protein